eukprot:1062975-Prymnesium_polylepis.1
MKCICGRQVTSRCAKASHVGACTGAHRATLAMHRRCGVVPGATECAGLPGVEEARQGEGSGVGFGWDARAGGAGGGLRGPPPRLAALWAPPPCHITPQLPTGLWVLALGCGVWSEAKGSPPRAARCGGARGMGG